MLKSTLFIALAVVVIASPNPKQETSDEIMYHHYSNSNIHHNGRPKHAQHQTGQQKHDRQQQHGHRGPHGQTKLRLPGPSKFLGWLGFRVAKNPRFPQLQKYVIPRKTSQYETIIFPNLHKSIVYSRVNDVKTAHGEHVKRADDESQVISFHDIAPIPEFYENSYIPIPVPVNAYSVPESVPPVEILPSTLFYNNEQIFQPEQSVVNLNHLPPASITEPHIMGPYGSSETSFKTISSPACISTEFNSFVKKQPSTVAPNGIPHMYGYDSSVNLAVIGGPSIYSTVRQTANSAPVGQEANEYGQFSQFSKSMVPADYNGYPFDIRRMTTMTESGAQSAQRW